MNGTAAGPNSNFQIQLQVCSSICSKIHSWPLVAEDKKLLRYWSLQIFNFNISKKRVEVIESYKLIFLKGNFKPIAEVLNLSCFYEQGIDFFWLSFVTDHELWLGLSPHGFSIGNIRAYEAGLSLKQGTTWLVILMGLSNLWAFHNFARFEDDQQILNTWHLSNIWNACTTCREMQRSWVFFFNKSALKHQNRMFWQIKCFQFSTWGRYAKSHPSLQICAV